MSQIGNSEESNKSLNLIPGVIYEIHRTKEETENTVGHVTIEMSTKSKHIGK